MKILNIILAVLGMVGLATAQENVLIADGSSSGTYKAFLKEIQTAVGTAIVFQEVESHGAVENLDLLVTNKVSMAFMHSDVLDFRSKREDLSSFKTLLTLFKEEVHFVAPRVSKRPPTKTGGTFGFGGTITPPPIVNTVEDLKGLRVGASGGSAITAQVIKLMGEIPYEFVSFDKGDEVFAALNSGTIDAAVFVGGAPLPNLEQLGRDYKLLSIGEKTRNLLKSVYSDATITYSKMDPAGVTTVAADALLVAKNYKSPKMINILSTVRNSFAKSLLDLQETPGIHKKWQEVSIDAKAKWPMLELPKQ